MYIYVCIYIYVCVCVHAKSFQSCLCVILWTAACQAPLSMGSSRKEHWTGLPCPPPGDHPDPGTEPVSLTFPAMAGRFSTTNTAWETQHMCACTCKCMSVHACTYIFIQMYTHVCTSPHTHIHSLFHYQHFSPEGKFLILNEPTLINDDVSKYSLL